MDDTVIEGNEVENKTWQEELMELLLSMSPDAFERLIQRVLRESGFSQVEVTGKTGDGGIDGGGIFKIAGLISFNVLFQCKRWQNSVTASDIRDFRGALQGRADKGLFATTRSFTRDALKEASRDGATPIDLLDGEFWHGKDWRFQKDSIRTNRGTIGYQKSNGTCAATMK